MVSDGRGRGVWGSYIRTHYQNLLIKYCEPFAFIKAKYYILLQALSTVVVIKAGILYKDLSFKVYCAMPAQSCVVLNLSINPVCIWHFFMNVPDSWDLKGMIGC